MSADVEPAVDRLRAMINGFRTTQVTYVLAKLRIADHLATHPLTASELSERVGANPDGLSRVLRSAALFGLLAEDAEGRYQLTEVGASLRSDTPNSLLPVAVQLGELHYGAWGALLHAARTGHAAFEHVYGAPLFEYLSTHPEAQATFDSYMSSNKDSFADALAEKYDFARFRVIVDVGGGNGSISAAILKRNPHLEAILFDQPQVVSAGAELLRAARVEDRCRLLAGDFFESVPVGGDVYMLSYVIHDWNDSAALRILRNCRAVMKRHAPLILLEAVLPPHGHPSGVVMSDMNMLVMLAGQERTEQQYAALLVAAGFRHSTTIPITDRISLIEGLPV